MGQAVYALPFIAILGIAIGIIMLIVAAVKKKPKKVSVIVLLLSIALLVVGSLASINRVIYDVSGGKLKSGDIVYIQEYTEPLQEFTTATKEYKTAIEAPDKSSPEAIKAHDEALAKLKESSAKMNSLKPGPNTQKIADETALIETNVQKLSEISKDAFVNEDTEKLLNASGIVLELMNNTQNIHSHLKDISSEL